MKRSLELKVINRSLQSLAGGICIFSLSFLLVYTLTDVLKLKSLAGIFILLVTWPHPIVGLVFPLDIEGKVSFDTVIVSMFLQIFVYSLFTYGVLEWREKRRHLP